MSTGKCDGTGLDDNGEPRKGPAYTADNGIEKILAQGVPAAKVAIGTAMYGRGWEGVYPQNTINDNPMTTEGTGKLTGTTANGVWEAGIQDYKGIKKVMIGASGNGINGFELGYDEQAEAAYAWNRTKGTLVSYDSTRSVKAKGAYVRSLGLAGLFAWEVDADNGDILNAMHEGLAGGVPTNHKPVVSLPTGLTVISGKTLAVTATATDQDNDSLTYSWEVPAALSATGTDSASISLTGADVTQDTDYLIKVNVSDGTATVSRSATVTVTAVTQGNTPPTIDAISDISIMEGLTADVTAVAADADGDSLTYTWSVPAGLTVQGSGANVTLVSEQVDVNTDYQVTVSVSDGQGSASTSFVVTVEDTVGTNNPPVVDAIADINMDEETVTAVTVNATDADGDTLTYTWNVPAGLILQGNGSNVSLTADAVDSDSSYSVSVTVTDGSVNVVSSFMVNVANVTAGDTTWDVNAVYSGGDVVKYNGVEYRAKWWTKGDRPDAGGPWEEVNPDNGGGAAWSASKVYNGGDKVMHGGEQYQAKWWTKGEEPGVAGVWNKL